MAGHREHVPRRTEYSGADTVLLLPNQRVWGTDCLWPRYSLAIASQHCYRCSVCHSVQDCVRSPRSGFILAVPSRLVLSCARQIAQTAPPCSDLSPGCSSVRGCSRMNPVPAGLLLRRHRFSVVAALAPPPLASIAHKRISEAVACDGGENRLGEHLAHQNDVADAVRRSE